MSVAALPTEYADTTFRSRTEARWAVFMDAMEIKWRYEPEGFDLDGVHYLPDFWLPGLDSWLEIKGVRPTLEEQEKCQWLADGTGNRVLLFWDEPRPPDASWGPENDQGHTFDSFGADYSHWWTECPHCAFVDVQFQGRATRLACRCLAIRSAPDNTPGYDSPRLSDAYAAARRAFTGPDFHGGRTPLHGSRTK